MIFEGVDNFTPLNLFSMMDQKRQHQQNEAQGEYVAKIGPYLFVCTSQAYRGVALRIGRHHTLCSITHVVFCSAPLSGGQRDFGVYRRYPAAQPGKVSQKMVYQKAGKTFD